MTLAFSTGPRTASHIKRWDRMKRNAVAVIIDFIYEIYNCCINIIELLCIIVYAFLNLSQYNCLCYQDFTMCLPFSNMVPCHRSVQNYIDFIGFSSRSPVLALI